MSCGLQKLKKSPSLNLLYKRVNNLVHNLLKKRTAKIKLKEKLLKIKCLRYLYWKFSLQPEMIKEENNLIYFFYKNS